MRQQYPNSSDPQPLRSLDYSRYLSDGTERAQTFSGVLVFFLGFAGWYPVARRLPFTALADTPRNLILLQVTWAAVCLAAVALSGCTSDKTDEPPAITVNAVQSALLQAKDLGSTWTPPDASPPPSTLPTLCAGDAKRPAIPGKPTAVTASAVDSGEAGAQSFDQVGLVYADSKAATAARDTLQAAAKACAATASHSPQATAESPEAGYTETFSTRPLTSGAWAGFAVLRHKVYEKGSAATGDTAVAVLAWRNAVLVASYAVYRIQQASQPPDFSGDWQRLVGAFVSRVNKQAG